MFTKINILFSGGNNMNENNRWEITPQQYVRKLFAETKDGKLDITNYPTNGHPIYVSTHEMDWNEEDVEALIQRFETLEAMLKRFGQMAEELEDEDKRTKLLTTEELAAWDVYIRPLGEFEVDISVINEISIRGEYDQLSDEEYDLLERYYEWEAAQFLQRLPFNRCSPRNMLIRAKRYMKLVYWDAPEIVAREEARLLAEEMVLYYCSRRKENSDEDR